MCFQKKGLLGLWTTKLKEKERMTVIFNQSLFTSRALSAHFSKATEDCNPEEKKGED